jgi:hypothetical protein
MISANWIGRGEVERSLEAACGLAREDGWNGVRAAIKSGIDAGTLEPIEPRADRPMPAHDPVTSEIIEFPSPRGWPQPKPLPSGLLPVAPFRGDFLPYTVAPWMEDISERMQRPPDFIGASAMVALGAVLGRKIGIGSRFPTYGD